MTREKVGSGWEHQVYASRKEGWVLKRPTRVNSVSMFILRYDANKVREEIHQAEDEAKEVRGVQIPRTRVVDFSMIRLGRHSLGRSYIIAQQYIAEDYSVPFIGKQLSQQGETTLFERYTTTPDNFKTNGGIIHLIDPSHAFYRYGERFGLSYQKLVDLRSRMGIIDRIKSIMPKRKIPTP